MKNGTVLLVLTAIVAVAVFLGLTTLKNKDATANSKVSAQQTESPPQSPVKPVAQQQDNALDMRNLTIQESAKLSKWIVLVKCLSSEVRETPDKNIFTFTDFEVLDSAKGNFAEKNLTLRTFGGKLGNVEVTKMVDIDFLPNRKYVLFLGDKNAVGYPTIDPQSIFSVEMDAASKTDFVSPIPKDLRLYEAKSGQPYKLTPVAVPLEDFLFSLKKLNK